MGVQDHNSYFQKLFQPKSNMQAVFFLHSNETFSMYLFSCLSFLKTSTFCFFLNMLLYYNGYRLKKITQNMVSEVKFHAESDPIVKKIQKIY